MNHNGKAFYAAGRLPKGQMNRTEAAYARFLDEQRHAGAVLWWKFEGLKLRLADNTFYTPDFAVLAADGILECHEIKGFWQDDARAKIKIAADTYPFRFLAFKAEAKKRGGGWVSERFDRIDAAPSQPSLIDAPREIEPAAEAVPF